MDDDILSVSGLSKSFGKHQAVDDLSFNVKRGSLFAFLGQNGAGKSTTINMLIGMLKKDAGTIVFDGNQSIAEFKDKIGVVFQNNIFDNLLTVEENVKLYGNLYSNKHVNTRYKEVAALLELSDIEKKRFKNLSGGQKRRAEIARALFNSPSILFLDEPTTGLDPKTRADVWSVIHKIRKTTGLTVFLTTHYMEETADADEVLIIEKGKKKASGTPAELKARYSYDKLQIVPYDKALFASQLDTVNYKQMADYFEIPVSNTDSAIEFLNRYKENIQYFEMVRGSMDDVFLNVINQNVAKKER